MRKVILTVSLSFVVGLGVFVAMQQVDAAGRDDQRSAVLMPLRLAGLNATDQTGAAKADNDTPDKTPSAQPDPGASGPAVATKLSPQEQAALRKMQLDMLKMQYEQARLGLVMNQIQLQKASIDLALSKRAMIEIAAQDEMNGVYMFYGPVTNETVKEAISDLNKLARRSTDEKGNPAPLTIVLDSPGGDVMAGLALYDHLRDLSRQGHHITVKVRGMAASMGGILLQAGDTRIISENAMMLIHEVSGMAAGKVSDMSEQVAFSDKLWSKLVEILAKRSTMKPDEIREKARKFNWWLDARDAVKLGFADKVE